MTTTPDLLAALPEVLVPHVEHLWELMQKHAGTPLGEQARAEADAILALARERDLLATGAPICVGDCTYHSDLQRAREELRQADTDNGELILAHDRLRADNARLQAELRQQDEWRTGPAVAEIERLQAEVERLRERNAECEMMLNAPPAQMSYNGELVPIDASGLRSVIDDASRLRTQLARAEALQVRVSKAAFDEGWRAALDHCETPAYEGAIPKWHHEALVARVRKESK